MKIKLFGLILILSLFTFGSCKQDGKEIETIGNFKVTTSVYENYYSAFFEKAVIFTGADKKTLNKYMCNPDQVNNPMIQELVGKLIPENNYEEYRQMLIIEQIAKKEGFTEKPLIKEILNQVVLETTIRLYLQEKMEERIKITMDEKQAQCAQLRKEYPDRVGPLPLDDCLYMAEMYLKQNLMRKEEGKLRDEIREGIVINKNKEFDRTKYLTEEFGLYKTMKKDGGCGDESAPTTESKEVK